MNYEARCVAMVFGKENSPMFSESNLRVELEDLASGEFVVLNYIGDGGDFCGKIPIEPEEWPYLREVINEMVGKCRKYD